LSDIPAVDDEFGAGNERRAPTLSPADAIACPP
jgi:hypothetical protein